VYVDGFNLFFGIRSKNPKAVNFDVASYVRSRLGSNQRLASVRYYSAPLLGNPEAERAQKRYFAALRASKVEVILGRFQQKTIHCEHCGQSIPSFEEKMTDVNIAVAMLTDAFEDGFDTALVVSGDSDLTTPIRQVRERFPSKRVIVAFPPKRNSVSLQAAATGFLRIGAADIRQAQLPDALDAGNGVVLRRPPTWR
jgi:uncharacterized LabA/DUF88 family protein